MHSRCAVGLGAVPNRQPVEAQPVVLAGSGSELAADSLLRMLKGGMEDCQVSGPAV